MDNRTRLKTICAVGSRPNFMKIAPIMAAIKSSTANIEATLVHTGRHYDKAMNHQFFTAPGIPCITPRNNTERQITMGEGTNTLVGQDRDRILSVLRLPIPEARAERFPSSGMDRPPNASSTSWATGCGKTGFNRC